MSCDIDDREGESPSPKEIRLGRTFHGSATGRRREHTIPGALALCQGASHTRWDRAKFAPPWRRPSSASAPSHTGAGRANWHRGWVDVPSLYVTVSEQRYEPLGNGIVRFRSGEFTADIAFDEEAFVVDYPGIARRAGTR
jgi:Putative glycolipid-binding